MVPGYGTAFHITGPFTTLRTTENGRYFQDDIFKRIFVNENIWISIKISLKFDPKNQINNNPAIFHQRIYASFGINVFKVNPPVSSGFPLQSVQ